MLDKKNILAEANEIINNRSEEKERQYGPMSEGFERAAMIASGMSGKEWNVHDMFIAMTALKLSRQSYNFKTDNLMDCCAYIGAWQNYIDETTDENCRKESIHTDNDQESSNFESKPIEYRSEKITPTIQAISPLSEPILPGFRSVDYSLDTITSKRRARRC